MRAGYLDEFVLCVDITTAQPLRAIVRNNRMIPSAVTGSRFSRRFVGQQQAGLVEQGAGDHQALLLSARKFERHLVVLGFQPDQLQYFVDTASDFRFGSPACGPHHVVEVLEHVAVGQQLIVWKTIPIFRRR